MKLVADTEKILDTSCRLSLAADELHQCMTDIELLVNSMMGEWLGEAGNEYVGKIVALKHEYLQLENLIKDFSAVLNDAADYYESYDNALTRKIEAI